MESLRELCFFVGLGMPVANSSRKLAKVPFFLLHFRAGALPAAPGFPIFPFLKLPAMHRLLLLFLPMALGLTACTPAAPPEGVPPNLLLVFVDDLGWGAVPPYGNPYQQLPALERLAAEGMTFTDAYVTPQCTPSRASLLTGQHTARNQMWHVIPGYGFPYMRMKEPRFRVNLPRTTYTLGKALQDAGYATALLGKWHLTQNEDGYYTYLKDEAKQFYGFDYVNPMTDPSEYHRDPEGDRGVHMLTQEAIRFMQQQVEAKKPFFVYLSHHTIHGKVYAPDSLVQKYKRQGWPYQNRQVAKIHYPSNATYLAALEHLDRSVGQLMEQLDHLGVADNTVLMFLSDNGGVDAEYENFPLRYGKGSPFEGGIRVPFLLRWPGLVPANTTSHEPVHVVDLYPTLLDMAGGKRKPAHVLDGHSLLPVLKGEGSLERKALYWYMPLYDIQWGATPCAVMREGPYKLIHFFGDYIDLEDGSAYHPGERTLLYDLANDVSETNDLSRAMPERTRRMKAQLMDWIQEMDAALPTLNPDYDPDSVYVRGPRPF